MAADNLVIRRATPDDAPGFVALMGDPEVYAGLLQLPWPTEARWRQRLSEPVPPSDPSVSIVGLRDGRLVASAGLHPTGPSLRRRHAMVLGISVAPDAQGQGVGTRMMAALMDYADRWGQVLRIELTVWADNERAIGLYRKFGFEVEGRLRGYALRDGAYVDALAMARLHPNPPRWA